MNMLSKEFSSENRLNAMRNPLVIGVTALLIFSFTVLVYLPTLKNGFVWDDIQYVIENKRIRSLDAPALGVMFTTFHVGNWHPLTWISHAIDYKLWGLDPTGHHLTNIILHGLNALVVFLLVLKLVMLAQELNGPGRTPTHEVRHDLHRHPQGWPPRLLRIQPGYIPKHRCHRGGLGGFQALLRYGRPDPAQLRLNLQRPEGDR